MSKITGVFPSLPVATTGQQLISHGGLNVVTSFVDALGFRGLCEDRLGQFVPSGARHRPGTILGSLAVMLAGGGDHVSDLDILRADVGVFGKAASNATVSRFFERTVTNPDLFSYGFATLMRELRSRVWESAAERNPALRATALDPLIVDLDATLVTSGQPLQPPAQPIGQVETDAQPKRHRAPPARSKPKNQPGRKSKSEPGRQPGPHEKSGLARLGALLSEGLRHLYCPRPPHCYRCPLNHHAVS